MSLPGNTLSSSPVPSAFVVPDDAQRADLRIDYEMGGAAVGDPSQGLLVQAWRAWSDGIDVWCAPDATLSPVTHLLAGSNITEVSFCFDQNMRPTVAYMDDSGCNLYWYDTLAGATVTTNFPGASSL